MATWRYVDDGNVQTVASGNLTMVLPTGLQQNDLIIAVISFRGNAAFTAPSGWTLHEQQSSGNTSTTTNASIGSALIASIVRGASNPSALTFTRTGGDVARGNVFVVRDDDLGLPAFQVSSSRTAAANSTTVDTAGLTTTTDNALVAVVIGGADNTTISNLNATSPSTASGASSNSPNILIPTNQWIEVVDSNTTTGADTTFFFGVAIKPTAGATGTISATAAASSRHAMAAAAFGSTPQTQCILIM